MNAKASMRSVTHACSLAIGIMLAGPALAQQGDHAAMNHGAPAPEPGQEQEPTQPVDHSSMDHGTTVPQQAEQEMDHATMGHDMDMQAERQADISEFDLPASAPPLNPIPPVTPADRAAAFPEVGGHPVHGTSVHHFVLLNRLEAWDADAGSGFAWDGTGWIGNDLDRMWVRSEGERMDSRVESDIEVFYGRAIARWWNAVVGIRHDFGDDPSQTFAAIGVIGLAPYKFEVEATAYVGQTGQTGVGVEAEYETLLTNRLILQWQVEAEAYGKDDSPRGIGSGLSTVEAGVRLRYEFTREFAPYIGVEWERAYGNTANLRGEQGENTSDTRFVAGLRIWF